MAADGNQGQKDINNHFGLPRATFKPIEPTANSSWLKVTAIIAFIVLMIGTGIVYWFFKRSSSSYKDLIAKALRKKELEQEEAFNEATQGELEDAAQDLTQRANTSSENLKTSPWGEAQGLSDQAKGSIQEMNAPQGRYYVIIASHIDKDLSMDYAKKLIKQHPYNMTIISPMKNKHFYRLSIADSDTFQGAVALAEGFTTDFGKQIWVLKY